MKARVSKMILLTSTLCAISFTVYGCSGEREASAREVQQMDREADGVENNSTQALQTDAATASAAGENAQPVSDGSDNSIPAEASDTAEEDMQKEEPTDEEVPDSWEDRAPDLEGDIKEMQDGQLTVLEAITSKPDDGMGDVMVVAAPGAEDSDFNKVEVTYDEKTVFTVKTIYDGGARSEVREATASDLEKERSVEVWGGFSEDRLKADRICIIEVVS